jgi:hypothetical protein
VLGGLFEPGHELVQLAVDKNPECLKRTRVHVRMGVRYECAGD